VEFDGWLGEEESLESFLPFYWISVFFFSRGLGAGFGGGGRGVKVLVGVVGGVRVLVCWWRVWVGK